MPIICTCDRCSMVYGILKTFEGGIKSAFEVMESVLKGLLKATESTYYTQGNHGPVNIAMHTEMLGLVIYVRRS